MPLIAITNLRSMSLLSSTVRFKLQSFLCRYYIELKGNISLKFINAKKLHSDNASTKHRTKEQMFIDFCSKSNLLIPVKPLLDFCSHLNEGYCKILKFPDFSHFYKMVNTIIYRGWLGQHEPCYNKNRWLNFKHSAKLLKHSTWIFKLSARLLVFCSWVICYRHSWHSRRTRWEW